MTMAESTRRDPPVPGRRTEYPQMALKGSVTVTGDIVGPVVPEDDWDSLRPPPRGNGFEVTRRSDIP